MKGRDPRTQAPQCKCFLHRELSGTSDHCHRHWERDEERERSIVKRKEETEKYVSEKTEPCMTRDMSEEIDETRERETCEEREIDM